MKYLYRVLLIIPACLVAAIGVFCIFCGLKDEKVFDNFFDWIGEKVEIK